MFARKSRSHASGASNLSLRANTLESLDALNGVKTLNNEFKVKRHADLLLRRLNSESSPVRTTEDFYKTDKVKLTKETEVGYPRKEQTLRTKTELGYPRTAQLEEIDKRKPVFTGESELLFDKNLEKYREWEVKLEPLSAVVHVSKKENLAKEKHNLHGNAIQETQLVGYDKYANDTLKNNVNLEKVREARRILRRRYANRANLQRIYAAWDDDRTGTINHANVFNMSKKLGLNLNVDEARVLLASANRSGTGELTIDEFLDLIYNKDDALNVDLDKLSSNLDENYLVKRDELYNDKGNILKKLQEDAQKTRENRHNNQVSLVLRNKFNSIVQFLLIADAAKVGYVNFEKFNETIKRLGINDQIVSDTDIRRLFHKYSEDQHTTNYRLLLEDLKAFRFRHEDMYTEIKLEKEKAKIIDPQEIIDEEVVITDCKVAPFNFVMNYIEKSVMINTGIKRYFPTKTDLKDYIAEKLKVEKEGVENQPLSQNELKDMVIGLFKSFDNSMVTKEHFDGFLSSFMYNSHGFTNVQELLETVYEGNDKTHFAKLAKLKPSVPPHPEIAKIGEGSNLIEVDEDDSGTLPRIRNNTEGDISSKEFNIDTDKKLKKILHKLDNQLFINNKHQYDLFRGFDKDNDGYVSHKDLAKRINELSLLNKNEIPRLLEYIDPENKGYVNFQEFNKRIYANVTNASSFGTLRSPSNMYPSKEFNQLTTSNVKGYTLKMQDTIKKTHPYYQYNLNCTTRFGSSPLWSNTFSNMQASTHSPMFISEAQRFDKQHQQRVVFQKDEQMKKKLSETHRINSLKSSINFFTDKIEKENAKMEKTNAHNMAKKQRERELYDQRAKLRNEFGN